MSILQNIRNHDDLAGLNEKDRARLCDEIREFLVSHIAKTGGHLASNLGTVELSVAIETVFDTRRDRLVFDVGHQSYVHKMLTGRADEFDRLRQFGGIAGFPKPGESETDAFVAGHASTSVSTALGMARARTLSGDNYHVIAVIGDGATTGGVAYEGLNDAAFSGEPLIVVLNDNAMSIDRNVGGVSRHLSRLRTAEHYLGAKKKYRSVMSKIPGGTAILNVTRAIKAWVKRMLIPTTIFENMGFTYLGPVDGHDLPRLISVLRGAKSLNSPVLVHVITKKGKGYLPAEEDPARFHGIGLFDPMTGKELCKKAVSFSNTFGETMLELGERNDKVCAITAAMPGGTGLLPFKQRFPKRTFDVGIAEEHAVAMAGGLAKQGMVPVVALYSTFLQRSFDMILQDVAMLHLHVVFAIDRAGLVGEDGETHHGVFDVGFLRQVPGMTVLCPASHEELKRMLTWAVEECTGPVAIRYPRGGDRGYQECCCDDCSVFDTEGACTVHRSGSDVMLVTYGSLLRNTLDAADLLAERGVKAGVVRLLTVSPLPVQAVAANLGACRKVIVVEETAANSGISDALTSGIRSLVPDCTVAGRNLGSKFVTHGSMDALYRACGLDAPSIADFAQEVADRG